MKSAKIFKIVVLVLSLMIYLVPKVEAEPMGTAITYQGSLNDAGSPADGLYDFQFRLFDDANTVTGNQVGSTIDINDLDVIEGYFTVELDFGINVFAGEARWLETTVAQSDGSDPCTLTPRVELTPTPYAIYAKKAGAGHSLDAADGYPTDVVYVDNDGYVGIGTTSPLSKLSVVGTGYFKDNVGIGTSAPESKLSIQMRSQSKPTIPPLIAPGLVIKGGSYNFGNQLEVQDSSGNTDFLVDGFGNVGIGTTTPTQKFEVGNTGEPNNYVRINSNSWGGLLFYDGEEPHSGGISYYHPTDALRFQTRPSSGNPAERMRITSNGKVGIGTMNPSSTLSVGGDGRSDSAIYGSGSDNGVYGSGSSTGVYGMGPSRGVSGYTASGTGRAVYGWADDNGNATNYGGYFRADGVTGRGVYGVSYGSEGYGVFGIGYVAVRGESAYNDGAGVSGESWSDSGYGVKAINSHSNGTGLYATGGSNGYAAEFDGDVKVTGAYKGNISSSSGSDGAPFPRPAYDSGWVAISKDESKILTHNIGGNVDNYVVDMQYKYSPSMGISNFRYADPSLACYYEDLDTSIILVYRGNDTYNVVEKFRIRIWVYN